MISINKSSCIFATIISFMLIILTLSCSEHERILSKRNDVQENYLQLSFTKVLIAYLPKTFIRYP